jgi:hypothetical protein
MWEVEIIEPKGKGVRADGLEEEESIKGKGAAWRVEQEFDGSQSRLSGLALSQSQVSTWHVS